ncbi:hypothetical protein QF046_002609 [Microbacterium sp. W4I4]|uniref:hypothetical protein n=1 Tax=Microbacterium sp. W4I4 TaxID=3042295 RepID=UPI00278399A3|nr:hypothetical protein [Microbacterium sp. W4I4]MDQ0614968.1 hypothetical protein [Microbacterium sp. W4I4]
MIDVDVTAATERERRRTWMLGGGLLAASALLGLALRGLLLPGLPFISLSDLLFSAGAVIFAVGLGRAGSVTARRPLGTAAIIALAAWLLVALPLQQLLLPMEVSFDDPAERGGYFQLVNMVGITTEAVSLVLAVIAVVQIGRAGVVPKPWVWAPLWALGMVVVARTVLSGMLPIPGLAENQEALMALFGLAGFLVAASVGFLGVLAMILAVRPEPRSTVVYDSGE